MSAMSRRSVWIGRACVFVSACLLSGCGGDEEKLTRLEEEKASLVRKVDALTKQIAEFQKLGKSADELADALRGLENMDDVVGNMRKEIEGLTDNLSTKVGELLLRDTQLANLQGLLEKNVADLTAIRTRFTSLEAELTGLRTQFTSIEKLADERLKALTDATKQIEQLTTALQTLQKGDAGAGNPLEKILPGLFPPAKKDPPASSPLGGG